MGGETSMAEMIATLSDACEREFGFLATRLFRVFKTEDTQGKGHLNILDSPGTTLVHIAYICYIIFIVTMSTLR